MAKRHALRPLVTVLKPNGRKPRRARWVDPTTGRKRVQNLPEDAAEADRWLTEKASELLGHRAQVAPPPGAQPALALMVVQFTQSRHRLRPSTLAQYKWILAGFQEFVGDKPITKSLLWKWRESIDKPDVQPQSVNLRLRHVKAFLNNRRKAGEIVLSRDAITEGLELLPETHEKKEPLTRAEIARLQRELIAANDPLYYRFAMVTLLTGMRRAESVRLNAGQIREEEIVLGKETKTKQGRKIELGVSPTVPTLLGEDFKGWKLTMEQVRERRRRIHPWVTHQRMRVTCGTYLACAPGIYGGASAYMAALRLGHSIDVATKHYLGAVKVPPEAKTLEAAMGLAAHPTE